MWRLTCCTGAGQVESNLSLFFVTLTNSFILDMLGFLFSMIILAIIYVFCHLIGGFIL